MNFEFPVLSVGSIAERQLANFCYGRVIAAFDGSFYLETDTGIVCVVGLDQGSSPLNILVVAPSKISWRASGIHIGVRGRILDNKLRIGNEFSFPLGDATVWQPPPPPVVVPRNVELGLSKLIQIADERGVEAGLGKFIDPAFHPGECDIVCRVASPTIARMRRWLVEEFGSCLTVSLPDDVMLRHFTGLGPGLTPSGSDFLGAMMIALDALKADELRDRLWSRLRPISQSMGNPISAIHLSVAAEGMGAEGIHKALNAILSADVEAIRKLVGEIDAVGHSSGWDAMAGFSMVLDTWLKTHRLSRG